MALNSSGPISIGGSTTGQSINLELGRAADASSNLNETALRTLAGVSSGTISLYNFYGKSNYLMRAFLIDKSTDVMESSVGAFFEDSSGNIYAGGSKWWHGGGVASNFLKMNSSGTVLVWKKITNMNGTAGFFGEPQVRSISMDSSYNMYIHEGSDFTGASNQWSDNKLIKLNSSGVVQWIRRYGYTIRDYAICCHATSTDVYVGGNAQVVGDRATLNKFNSSGTHQWSLMSNASSGYLYQIVSDSSGNVYTANADYVDATYNRDLFLTKFNSSGTVQWQKRIGPYAGADWGQLFYFSNYIYLFHGLQGSILKFDLNGTLIWQKQSSGSTSMAMDSSGNIYLGQGTILAKFNSDLTVLIWCRTFTGTTITAGYSFAGINKIEVVNNKLVLSCSEYSYDGTSYQGSLNLTTNLLYLNYPLDGSKTGTITYTHGGITITASSWSIPSTTSLTVGTGTVGYATYSSNPTTITATEASVTNRPIYSGTL